MYPQNVGYGVISQTVPFVIQSAVGCRAVKIAVGVHCQSAGRTDPIEATPPKRDRLPRVTHILERRRLRHPNPHRGQGGVREAAVIPTLDPKKPQDRNLCSTRDARESDKC